MDRRVKGKTVFASFNCQRH